MECGIIGLPGTGKTSLFVALTGAAPDPAAAAAGRPNVGIAPIPDPRLDLIAGIIQPPKVTHATLGLVDIPGIDAGQGAARNGPRLAQVRQVDALCEVVRCFDGGRGPVNPLRDITALEEELILADLAVVEPALDKARRASRSGEAEAKARTALLEKLLPVLEDGRPARTVTGWTDAEAALLRSYGMMTAKRILYVANVAEDDLNPGGGDSPAAAAVREHAASHEGETVVLCTPLEAELAEITGEADRREMLEGLGLQEPAIGPLARALCRLLGLQVFYTAGDKEVRAWTVGEGATAPEAAGVIHTDMQRGFIRAECYHVDDLAHYRGEKAIKAAGKLRTEGKSYRVRDGDVIHVLFNV